MLWSPILPSVLWCCWLGGRKGIQPVKNWVTGCWHSYLSGARYADLHMAQRMPLPLTVSCFSKIHVGFTFLVLAHPGSPGQRAVKRVCVCVMLCSPLFDAKKASVQVVLQVVHSTEKVWSSERSSKVEPLSNQTQKHSPMYWHHQSCGKCLCTEETTNVLHWWRSVAFEQLRSTRDTVLHLSTFDNQ